MAGALDGQVGIVTGAGRGIGRATAQALGAAGMHVVAGPDRGPRSRRQRS